jgi:hypothetical protein
LLLSISQELKIRESREEERKDAKGLSLELRGAGGVGNGGEQGGRHQGAAADTVEEQLGEGNERGIRGPVAREGSPPRGPGAADLRGPVPRQGP